MKYIHVCNFVTVIVYKINSMFSIKQLFSYLPCISIRQYNIFIYRQCATVSIASDMMVNVTSNHKSEYYICKVHISIYVHYEKFYIFIFVEFGTLSNDDTIWSDDGLTGQRSGAY